MNDSDRQGLSGADWLRYGFLAFLASLVFVVVYGNRPGTLTALLAVYLLLGAGSLAYLQWRRSRS